MSDGHDPVTGFASGSRIAGYLLETQIGRGGMAVVFRALDERLDRQVALKILAPALASDQAFRQRFVGESRAAAAVDDPHIIPVFEAGEASGVLFIAMRYVRGGDVGTLVRDRGPLSPGRAAEIISQAASALDAAHGHGLVHRDVKPGNMLLDASESGGRPDHVYLSDFGLSKASEAVSGLTGTGVFLGTLDYAAPEQIEGKRVDGRTDQYALACAAYELLSGTPPFRRDSLTAVMYAQLSEPPPPVTRRRTDLPPRTDDVFARALAKSPADRYESCREFAEAMRLAFGLASHDSGPTPGAADYHPPTEVAGPVPASADAAHAVPTEAPRADPGRTPPGRPGHEAGRTSPHFTPTLADADGDGAARHRGWRSPGSIAAAVLVVLLLAGGGGYLALRGPSGSGPAALAPPGCTTSAADGKSLGQVPSNLVSIPGGNPFSARVSPDGRFVFAVTPTTVQVLAKDPGLALRPLRSYPITNSSMPAKGSNLTGDGKYLLVAVGAGISVLSVPNLESGAGNVVVGNLTSPAATGNAGAVKVGLSPGDQFAFVTLQYRNEMAVFNLRRALTSGFGSADYIGAVQLPFQPVGISGSPDGKWLYVTSLAARKTGGASQGLVNVLNMARLETRPAAAVVSRVTAGCSPARVVASADGKMVWVTARASNYILGFAADRLRTSPGQALVAKVRVGHQPVGMVLLGKGTKMVVADAGGPGTSAAGRGLAVVSLSAAMAHRPALLGYVKSGLAPRESVLVPGARYLIVSDSGSAQLQVVDLNALP